MEEGNIIRILNKGGIYELKKKNNYVENDILLDELQKYKESGVMSEELGLAILTIASNYANKGNFSGYTWKDDMIGEAVLTCMKYIHKFDPEKYEKPNPFAYITTICKNAFLMYIKKQQKHSAIKDRLYNSCQEYLFHTDKVEAFNYRDFR
jgi:DNA-directed RNA polymerase specialized sigma subunit